MRTTSWTAELLLDQSSEEELRDVDEVENEAAPLLARSRTKIPHVFFN